MVFDFKVDPVLPVQRPCTFTLKAWDKDPLSMKSNLLGFNDVHLDDLIDDAMRDAIQMKKRKQHIDELMADGQLSEMEECLRVYEVENEDQEAKRQRAQERAKETRVAKSAYTNFSVTNKAGSGCDCCYSLFQKKAGSLLDESLLDESSDGGALTGTVKYRTKSEHRWTLHNLHGDFAGKVGVSVELLQADAAAERPCGKGRSAPNEHPVLEDPERETISVFKPLGALRFLVRDPHCDHILHVHFDRPF